MKKILLSVLLIVAMLVNVLAFTGCGKKNDDDVEVVAYDGSEVEITFASNMGQALQGIFDTALVNFNKMYPNIKVNHVTSKTWDDLRSEINTKLGAGKQPNLAYCYPDHVATYNNLKGVLALDDFINSTATVTKADGTTEIMGLTAEQQADFVKTYWDEGKVFDTAGTMYTLPMAKSTEALYYNKDFFDNFEDEQGGISVPTTWEEMESVCRRIKAKYPDSVPLVYDSEANWFITRLEQAGAGYTSVDPSNRYLFNNETAMAILEEANEWYQAGLVRTQATNNGQYGSTLFTIASDTAKDKCFMVIGSTGGASYQTPPKAEDQAIFEVGITGIPQENAAAPKTISQGPSLCLFKDSDPQKVAASWLLMKFLTTNVEFQCSFSIQSGYAPVIGAAKNDATYKNWLDTANGKTNLPGLCVKVTIDNEAAYFTSPAFNGSSTARIEAEGLIKDIMVYTGSDVRVKAGSLLAAALGKCQKG